jgi:hypothetical protein
MFGASDSYLFLMVPQLVARGKMGWTIVEVQRKSLKLEASPKGLIRS